MSTKGCTHSPSVRFRKSFIGILLLLLLYAAQAFGQVTFNNIVTPLTLGTDPAQTYMGVAVDSSGTLYALANTSSMFYKVGADGQPTPILVGNTLQQAIALAVDTAGNIFIADTVHSRILKVSSTGNEEEILGGGLLNRPTGIAVAPDGTVYVSDTNNNRIIALNRSSSQGPYVATTVTISGVGGTGDNLSYPNGLAVDSFGNLYIVDAGKLRVVKVTPTREGSLLDTHGVALSMPTSVAVDSFHNVYIADMQGVVKVPAGGSVASVLDIPGYNGAVTPYGVAVDDAGFVYVSGVTNFVLRVRTTLSPFPHVSVRAASGATQTLSFTVASGTTLGSVKALTLGAENLDFTVVTPDSDTTCASGVTGTTCSVKVQFLPTAPGLRRGALVFYDNSNNPLLTMALSGTGDAPLAVLSPGKISTITMGDGITPSLPSPRRIAIDGAGSMYVGGGRNENLPGLPLLVKVASNGGPASPVNIGYAIGISGLALDGTGNLFVADGSGGSLQEVSPAGTAQLTLDVPDHTAVSPADVAVDAAGDLYVADASVGRIVKARPPQGATGQVTLPAVVITPQGYSFPHGGMTGIALDPEGNIYVTDTSNYKVVKIAPAGIATALDIPGITVFSGVAVDGMGNVLTGTSTGLSILTKSGQSSEQSLGSAVSYVTDVRMDAKGNRYVLDQNDGTRITKIDASSASLTFADTLVHSQNPASQTVAVANLGNQTLTFSVAPSFTSNFPQAQNPAHPIHNGDELQPGNFATVDVKFTPQTRGNLSDTLSVTDNSLNQTSTQQITVSGKGLVPPDATAVAVTPSMSSVQTGQTVDLTAVVTDMTTPGTIPTGTVLFADSVNGVLNGGSPVTLDSEGKARLTGVTLTGLGGHLITATYYDGGGSFNSSDNTITVTATVQKYAATVTGPATQPVQFAFGQQSAVDITVTGVSGSPVPTGKLNVTLRSGNAPLKSGTANLTVGAANATASLRLPTYLSPGNYTFTISYLGDDNYGASSTPITIAVQLKRVTPTINWAQPAAITYGMSLSGILNATATGAVLIPAAQPTAPGTLSARAVLDPGVAGSFTYTASLGVNAVSVTGATVLTAGTYTLTASFIPNDTSNYTSASKSVSLTVGKATATITLTTSANPVLVTSAVTFTATIASTEATPTGNIVFYDGTTALGTVALTNGVASFTTSSLTIATHSITAAYAGNNNFSSVSSSAIAEVVQDFSVSPGSGTSGNGSTAGSAGSVPTQTISAGGTATYTVIVGPTVGTTLAAPVTLSLSHNMPAGSTALLGLVGTTTTGTTLVIPAGQPMPGLQLLVHVPGAPSGAGTIGHNHLNPLKTVPFAFGFLLLPFGGRLREAVAGKHARRTGLWLLLGLLSLASLIGLSGCGAVNSGYLTEKNYTITVTATSGSLSHSTNFNLVVR